MDDIEYSYTKKKVRDLIRLDLDFYKEKQMRRRLTSFLERSGTPDPALYFKQVESDRQMLQQLQDFLTINVSEFFRDEKQFTELHHNILPELLAKNRTLNIWSAGCSNGSEPYTLAIMLAEISERKNHRILATDLDETILTKAKAGGPYNPQDIRNVAPELLSKYFRQSENQYWVTDEIRKKVTFSQHNLLNDPYETNLDLITCRNVVIYFTSAAKNNIHQEFHRSLKDGGILFVGGTEIIFDAQSIGFEIACNSFYRKKKPSVSIQRS